MKTKKKKKNTLKLQKFWNHSNQNLTIKDGIPKDQLNEKAKNEIEKKKKK